MSGCNINSRRNAAESEVQGAAGRQVGESSAVFKAASVWTDWTEPAATSTELTAGRQRLDFAERFTRLVAFVARLYLNSRSVHLGRMINNHHRVGTLRRHLQRIVKLATIRQSYISDRLHPYYVAAPGG